MTSPAISAPPNVVVGAADGYVDLPVTLNVPGINPVTVNYNTSNGSGLSNTVCSGNSTYQGFGTVPVTFLPGVTTQVVRIPLLNCTASDSSGFYTFYLNLFSASGATIADNLTQVDVTGNAPAAATSGLFVKNAVVDASAGTVQVPGAARWTFGLGPGSAGDRQLHDRRWIGDAGHGLSQRKRHPDLPGR